ncbi:MAG: hypothetical protein JO316_26655 [Abitibacteriaceae bacterium]|nr:hypothetical protein [Abditibacteriaceae bacterium]
MEELLSWLLAEILIRLQCRVKQGQQHLQAHSITVEASDSGGYQVVE